MTRAEVTDCWNHIGVRGDSSCPQLATHIHCRNCPVYSAAATTLLDASLGAEDLAAATREVARPKTVTAANTHSVVIFRIGAEWLALPTAIVREIAGPRPIHALPHRRDGVVLGLANIRGQLLVCAALGRILNLEEPSHSASDDGEARMLVTTQGGASTVYPVAEVFGVQRFAAHDLAPVPAVATVHVSGVLSWQAKSVSLINPDLLLSTINRSLASAIAI